MATLPIEKFMRGFGVRKPQSLRLDRSTIKDSIGSLLKFSDNELPTLIHRHAVAQKDKNFRPSGLTDIIGYLQPEHERSVQLVQDAERAKTLVPEIGQAEKILVSSIMSPNDLQEADPIYEIENVPYIPESVINKICEYLKDRFTNEYHLGEKLEHWTKEALFRSGAAVILTLPESTLANLANSVRTDPYNSNNKNGYENLESYCKDSTYNALLNKKIYKRKEGSSLENINTSIEDRVKEFYTQEVKASIESILFEDINNLKTPLTDSAYKKMSSAVEALTATIVTKLEEGDVIKISENPEVLRFGKAVRHYQRTKLGKDFDELWKEQNKNIGKVTNMDQEQILDLTNYMDYDATNESLPYNIEIPAEAVIPVCVPGQKVEKLGYFVLVDSHGQPIDATKYVTSGGGCTTSSRIASSYATMYGQVPTPGGIQSPISGFLNLPGMTFNPSEQAMNNVFNYILDNVLRKKLRDVGLNEVTFDKYETIATCMFYRMLENKQTSLIFVPDAMITYIAFDYRDNGCGKSLLEDINFVLSLICVLLVTNTMAQMKNAVAKQEITITFDNEEINEDQVIEQVKNIAIQKSQINLTTNPSDIMRTVTDQNTSVKAVNHPNAPGFNIERTYTTDQMPQADTDLLEKLQNWLTTAFGIPHSVFNQLDDAEFSRSIATSNLFFSQLIRSYQKKLCQFVTNFIKLNLKYSPTIREGLFKILNNHIDGKKDDKDLTTPISDGGKDIKGEHIDVKKALIDVINHITVSLPAPNIAPNKAQYDLISEFKNILDGIVDNLYPDDLVRDDDMGSAGLTVLKAFQRSSITRNLLQHMGLNTGLDIQDLDDFYINNRETIMALGRLARNFNKDIEKDKTAQTTDSPDESSDNSSSSGDDFGSSSDNDFGSDNESEGGDNGGGNSNDDFDFSGL